MRFVSSDPGMQSIIGDKYIYESTDYIDWTKHRSMEKVNKKKQETTEGKKKGTFAPAPSCLGLEKFPLIPILRQCIHLRQVLEQVV